MSEPTPRRRAPGMSAEDRRAMIVAAALPLIAEHGAAVTTSRIAKAAGIGEATIFRVFRDKDELLDACVAEAVNPAHVLRALGTIRTDQPLAARLVQAAEAVRGHLARIGEVVGAVHASGHRRPRGDRLPEPGARERSMRTLHDALATLIAPDADTLRLAPGKAAAIVLGTLFTRPLADVGTAPSTQELIDVLLHGILAAPGKESS